MRARYYSPEMKRFINADIIPGRLSNAVTLNRFAYANGNPVSLVDPFGLSAERNVESNTPSPNYTQAVFVSNFNYLFPINITGHTQLYFWDDNNKKWYITEFTGSDKSTAKVIFKEAAPPMYDVTTGQCNKDIDGINYVVLTGNFNDSVALAEAYKSNGFGRYNFLFHNCADYTNELLDVANIDGMSSQILSEGITFPSKPISIPVLREIELSVSDAVDSGIEWASDGLVDLGNSMKGSNIVGDVVGSALVGTGNFIDGATNFVGDAIDVVTGVAGEFVDDVKDVVATVTNAIADGAQAAWEWISFWD